MTTPLALASLTVTNMTFSSFASGKPLQFGKVSLVRLLADVRELYEMENIQNKVVDGTEPFPENKQSLRNGISVEFRWLYYSSLHVGISKACISGMYRSSTLVPRGMLSGMFRSRSELVSFA